MTNSLLTPFSNVPVNGPLGLGIRVASTTTLTVAAGFCMDEEYTVNMFVDSALTINSAVKGVGGLDTGTIAASTLYYVYLVYDGRGVEAIDAIISTSATAPVMPEGYGRKKRIGFCITDSSSHFLTLVQRGEGNLRQYWFDTLVTVLNAGTSATFANVNLTGYMPIIESRALFNASFTPDAAADIAAFRPGNSSSTAGCAIISGVVAAQAQQVQVVVPVSVVTGAPIVQYLVTASGSLTLKLAAIEDNIE